MPKKKESFQTHAVNGGFWQLYHSELAALLACPGLSWATVRVYLALADLTRGHGKSKDIVSLDQIGNLAHTDHWHTCRALKKLSRLGLYRDSKVSTRKILRWVVWPAPSGLSRKDSDSALEGTNTNISVSAPHGTDRDSARVGAKLVPKPASVSAGVGTHQYTNNINTLKKREKKLPDPRVKQFIDWFYQKYKQAVGRDYIISGGKDGQLVKSLLSKLSLDQLKQAAQNMLADDWGQSKASIGILSSQINSWLGTGKRQQTSSGTFTPALGSKQVSYNHLSRRYK